MQNFIFNVKLVAGIAILAMLFACGGGGSSSSALDGGGTTIVAVDPYIVGATFQEIDPDGVVIQTSEPTNELGEAVFEDTVQVGNTIKMLSTGIHSGTTFRGTLKRKVDVAGTSFVVSPLTTLAAELGSDAAAVAVLRAAGLDIEEADLFVNPLLLLADKTPADLLPADLRGLIANLAVNAALNMVGSGADNLEDIIELMVTILGNTDLLDALEGTDGADIDDLIGTLAGVTDFLIVANNIILFEEGDGIEELLLNAIKVDGFDWTPYLTFAAENDGIVVINPYEDEPEAATLTVRAKLEKAYDLLDDAAGPEFVLLAADLFSQAKALIAIDTAASQADKDEAYFFGAFTGLLSVAKPYSDYTDNGLNNLGDILDAIGIDDDIRDDFDAISGEINALDVPSDAPTTEEIQQALAAMLLGKLQLVAADLSNVSSSFALSREEVSMNGSGATDYDSGDAQFLKGIALAMRAQINLISAYDLDVSLDNEEYAEKSIQTILAENPDFASLVSNYEALLTASKADLSAALDTILAAINTIDAETDDQTDDLIAIYSDSCEWNGMEEICTIDDDETAEDIAQMKADIQTAKTGLNGPVTFNEGEVDEISFDFSQLFTGVDLREQIPTYTGDVPGMFPDTTLGGVLDDNDPLNLNEDLDGDGSPDLLMGYTRFFDGLLANNTANFYYDRTDFTAQFNTVDKSFSLSWNNWSMMTSGTETGTYSIEADGSLLLTNDDSASMLFATLTASIIEPAEEGDMWFGVEMTAEDEDGNKLSSDLVFWEVYSTIRK